MERNEILAKKNKNGKSFFFKYDFFAIQSARRYLAIKDYSEPIRNFKS